MSSKDKKGKKDNGKKPEDEYPGEGDFLVYNRETKEKTRVERPTREALGLPPKGKTDKQEGL